MDIVSQVRRTQKTRSLLQGLLLTLTFLQLAACAAPSYYVQAASGHLDMVSQREEITGLIDSASTDPELARELALSVEIRTFAITRLQLPDNGSYTQFVQTGRDAVTWNVIAAPEFSLDPRRWCFLVSGCVSYRGYFKQQDAQRLANKLAARDYDTAISPVIAYSTLGWFEDPLLDTMLRYGDEQLAAFIFHELAHQQLYVSGDTDFSESYASFIEQTGVRLWLKSSGRERQLADWQKSQRAGLQFNALLEETRTKLGELYHSGLPDDQMRMAKSALFENFAASYELLVNLEWEGRSYFGGLFSGEINNASLALAGSYRAGTCAFEMLYREAQQDMARFQQLAAARAGLGKAHRRAWLNQPCEVIASGGDL